MLKIKKQKVTIGLSGGVDSSVATVLLKKQGYELNAVFLKLFKGQTEKPAKQIAKHLNIPFTIIDFQKEFKKYVIDYFLKQYSIGRTPNPCIICNQKIKFGLFLQKALESGANYIATGHYVKKISNQDRYKLLIPKDKQKDQSYFLWTLTQHKLKHILFPLGNYNKSEVYQLAKKFSLPYSKKESSDICFLKNTKIKLFLKKYLKLKKGDIIDVKGKILGKHNGLALYTIGQRQNIGIGGIGPYYVVKMDFQNNNLIVTNLADEKQLYKKELLANKINWISGKRPQLPLKCAAKIRYRQELASVIVERKNKTELKVLFNKPQRAITSGQSIVFYNKNELLGGGIIN